MQHGLSHQTSTFGPSLFDHILSAHAAANVATARALAVEDEPEEPEPLTGNPYIDRRNAQYAQWEE